MEEYGKTKEEYRKLIENPDIKVSQLAKMLPPPDRVYRFRRLGRSEGEEWIESKHWKDEVYGVCKFSKPSEFSSINDSNDCKVRFDCKEMSKYIAPEETDDNKLSNIESKLEDYKAHLQETMRVGCFTSVSPYELSMWNNPDFGDNGKGICIEYEVDDENFKPDGLAFLPVLYDNNAYDNTEVIKAIVDYNRDNSNPEHLKKMVTLGYGHTLIKNTKFESEREWRLVIPEREDGKHKDYYNVDKNCKRDMSSAIKAIYLGFNISKLNNYEKYRDAIIQKAKPLNVPVYQMSTQNEHLLANPIL